MLLNEFLKEHRKVEEQERRILEQEATVARLKTDLEANAAWSPSVRWEVKITA